MNYAASNEAKLELAADYGLQARFNYPEHGTGKLVRRTLDVESIDSEAVYGETDDGYRHFKLDKIDGKVVIR